YLERVAQRRTVSAGEPLRALAARLRTPLFEPGGALAELSEVQQGQLYQHAKELAEVFQRSSSNIEGRNGSLSLRNHQLRGLDRPRKRACLTVIHNFYIYLLVGDEVVATKAGQHTHGLDRFFASLYGKPVAGLAFFTLSLVSTQQRRSFPIRV